MSDTSAKQEYKELNQREGNLDAELRTWGEKSTQKYEMNLLHKYNDVKDAAQVLLGAIANMEGITVKELHERFQLPLSD